MSTPVNLLSVFEGAIAYAILQSANFGEDVPRIRRWQKISADERWKETNDRLLPVIDIRAKPPVVLTEDRTCRVSVMLQVMSSVSDDPDHTRCSDIYNAVQSTVDRMMSDNMHAPQDIALKSFLERIGELVVDQTYDLAIGGFETGETPTPSSDVDEGNLIGIELIICYNRTDF